MTDIKEWWAKYLANGILHGFLSTKNVHTARKAVLFDVHVGENDLIPAPVYTFDNNDTATVGLFGDHVTTGGFNNNDHVNVGASSSQADEEAWHMTFRTYSLFILIFIGVIGNALSAIIFSTSHLRKTAPGYYIIALSIVDTLILFAELYIIVDIKTSNTLDKSDAACKVIYYLRYALKLVSSLFVVAVAIERFMLVVFPLKRYSLSTTRTAKITIFIVSVGSLVVCSYAFFTLGKEADLCSIVKGRKIVYIIMDLVISVGIGEILSSLIIFLMTGIIVKTLTTATKWRRETVICSDAGANHVNRTQNQVTVMLVTVAISFVVLRTPYTVVWFMAFVYEANNKHYPTYLDPLLDVFYVVAVLNYTINFFLYCITGKNVRKRLVHCSCFKMIHGRNRRDSTTSSQHELTKLRVAYDSRTHIDRI